MYRFNQDKGQFEEVPDAPSPRGQKSGEDFTWVDALMIFLVFIYFGIGIYIFLHYARADFGWFLGFLYSFWWLFTVPIHRLFF